MLLFRVRACRTQQWPASQPHLAEAQMHKSASKLKVDGQPDIIAREFQDVRPGTHFRLLSLGFLTSRSCQWLQTLDSSYFIRIFFRKRIVTASKWLWKHNQNISDPSMPEHRPQMSTIILSHTYTSIPLYFYTSVPLHLSIYLYTSTPLYLYCTIRLYLDTMPLYLSLSLSFFLYVYIYVYIYIYTTHISTFFSLYISIFLSKHVRSFPNGATFPS